MADGIVKINKNEAIERAKQMEEIAASIETLLQNVKNKMNEINDEEMNLYYGGKKPSELSAELEEYSQEFANFHIQIDQFAENIITTANTMAEE